MKISIDEFWAHIGKDKWTGYIWRVSTKNPEVFEAESIPKKVFEKYNLIQEANLYCSTSSKGLHIKQIDGEEMVFLYDLNKYKKDESLKLDQNSYSVPSAKGKMPKHLIFNNLYRLTSSQISVGMESWIQVAQIFVGFKN